MSIMLNVKEENILQSIPKGDLHVHLNGAIPTDLVKNILEKDLTIIPSYFDLDKNLNILEPQNHLSDYLKPWEVLNLLPKSKEDLNLIVLGTFRSFQLANISFVEIRNTILYIAKLNFISVESAILWLLDALNSASRITGIHFGLIITIRRSSRSTEDLKNILSAIKNIGNPEGIVGLDLAGNEDTPVPDDLAYWFTKAKYDLNLGITIHAGETGNINNILVAINQFGADRIGHGTAAMNCLDTMDLLRTRDIAVEVCPISNRRTNSIKEDDAYTFHKFMEHNVPFILCSDNPAIHKLSLVDDYRVFLDETEDLPFILNQFTLQKKYSFIKDIN